MLLLLAPCFAAEPRLSLETEVLTDVFGGLSVQLRRSSTLLDRLTVGVALMRIDIPEGMLREYNGADRDTWDVSQAGGRLLLDYHLGRPDRGLSLGAFVSLDSFGMTHASGETVRSWHVGEGARLGYTWRPFDDGLYVFPAVALLNLGRVAGRNTVRGDRFDADTFGPMAMLNLGFTLGGSCPSDR